jgi:hypothetical protein
MSLLNWFKNTISPAPSPRLREIVSRALAFLQTQPTDQEFRPKIVAKAIGEPTAVALMALGILRDQGLLEEHYGVHCGVNSKQLKSYRCIKDIPKSLPCEDCEKSHSILHGKAFVDIYYTVNTEEMERLLASVSIAA